MHQPTGGDKNFPTKLNKLKEIPAQEKQLTDLASEEKLIKANQIITEARHQLEEKAEEYAVNRLAEHLVARAYSQLLEETKGAVLGNAGKLLGKITSGEYSAVDLAEEGEEQDFVAVPSGSKGLKTPALSRGTRNSSFYLSAKPDQAIEPPLPVIMDDSMAISTLPIQGRLWKYWLNYQKHTRYSY